MTDSADLRDPAFPKAEAELGRLNSQVAAMRAVLVKLLQDVVEAERRLDSSQASQLLEANERLIVTALDAQTEADTAAGALDEAVRSSALDPLTALPNRTRLLDRMAHAFSSAKRHGKRVGLLFLDLNNFKHINDTFGHAMGDRALQLVAACLNSLVRETDTVSRHGGDEFLVLLAEISQASDAALIAEKVNSALAAYGQIDGQKMPLSASIGISIYPDDAEDAPTLIERADAAMYLAKRFELGGFVFHTGQSSPQPAPAGSDAPSGPRLTHRALTEGQCEQRHAHLRETNERLVLTVLDAQHLLQAAEEVRQNQAELMAFVAQELNNPFAPIRIAASMLGRLHPDWPLLPRAQALIEQQVDQLARRVGALVDSGRLVSGKLTLEVRPFDVAAVVRDTVQAFRPALGRRLQTIAVNVPQGPLEMRGDRALFAQIISNLLDNASKCTHDGGAIEVSVAVEGNTLTLTVADNGGGIAAGALTTIFDPFVRDLRIGPADAEGLGIGLTVVRAIVEAHGGSVVATSPGRGLGSRFIVSLPATPFSGIA